MKKILQNIPNKLECTVTYKAQGTVIGECSCGNRDSVPSRIFEDTELDRLKIQIQKALKDGSIDDDFGFEEILACKMEITTIETVEIEGKPFKYTEYYNEIF